MSVLLGILAVIAGILAGMWLAVWGIMQWFGEIFNTHKVTPMDFMNAEQRKELQDAIETGILPIDKESD